MSWFNRQEVVASALVRCGFARWSRGRRAGQAAVLSFHGVRPDGASEEILDVGLHIEQGLLRAIVEHLARHYDVVSLAEVAAAARGETELSGRAVAVAFDDGYASNYELAMPILMDCKVPATVFLTSSFQEGALLWFHRVDWALNSTRRMEITVPMSDGMRRFSLGGRAQRVQTMNELLRDLKKCSWDELKRRVASLEAILEVMPPCDRDETPHCLRGLSWDQAKEMAATGLVELGGHTHEHPILACCTETEIRAEIDACYGIITDRIGSAPKLFAYPNGGESDFNLVAQSAISAAGFTAAFSMINGFVMRGQNPFALHRYGAPESVHQAEATVSGAFESVKEWRTRAGRKAATV